MERPIVIFPPAPRLQVLVDDITTKMPITLARILTPLEPEMGNITVVHPTDNDPVLLSEKLGTVALWFNF
jgi:hypothetical protein